MLPAWTWLIALHAIAASLALVLGAFQILRPTKGDAPHKAIGRLWVGLMLFVALGSWLFGGYESAIDIFLRALAVWTTFSVIMAIIQARRGNIDKHRGFMVGTYFGLIGAFVGVLAFRTRRVPAWFIAEPLMMSLIAVAIIAVGGFVVAGIMFRTRPRTISPTDA